MSGPKREEERFNNKRIFQIDYKNSSFHFDLSREQFHFRYEKIQRNVIERGKVIKLRNANETAT